MARPNIPSAQELIQNFPQLSNLKASDLAMDASEDLSQQAVNDCLSLLPQEDTFVVHQSFLSPSQSHVSSTLNCCDFKEKNFVAFVWRSENHSVLVVMDKSKAATYLINPQFIQKDLEEKLRRRIQEDLESLEGLFLEAWGLSPLSNLSYNHIDHNQFILHINGSQAEREGLLAANSLVMRMVLTGGPEKIIAQLSSLTGCAIRGRDIGKITEELQKHFNEFDLARRSINESDLLNPEIKEYLGGFIEESVLAPSEFLSRISQIKIKDFLQPELLTRPSYKLISRDNSIPGYQDRIFAISAPESLPVYSPEQLETLTVGELQDKDSSKLSEAELATKELLTDLIKEILNPSEIKARRAALQERFSKICFLSAKSREKAFEERTLPEDISLNEYDDDLLSDLDPSLLPSTRQDYYCDQEHIDSSLEEKIATFLIPRLKILREKMIIYTQALNNPEIRLKDGFKEALGEYNKFPKLIHLYDSCTYSLLLGPDFEEECLKINHKAFLYTLLKTDFANIYNLNTVVLSQADKAAIFLGLVRFDSNPDIMLKYAASCGFSITRPMMTEAGCFMATPLHVAIAAQNFKMAMALICHEEINSESLKIEDGKGDTTFALLIKQREKFSKDDYTQLLAQLAGKCEIQTLATTLDGFIEKNVACDSIDIISGKIFEACLALTQKRDRNLEEKKLMRSCLEYLLRSEEKLLPLLPQKDSRIDYYLACAALHQELRMEYGQAIDLNSYPTLAPELLSSFAAQEEGAGPRPSSIFKLSASEQAQPPKRSRSG